MEIVKATDLARNTREILDRVTNAGETVAIERNNILIAQIGPAQKQMTASQAFAGLPAPSLTPLQASDWLKDGRDAFSDSVRDPWA